MNEFELLDVIGEIDDAHVELSAASARQCQRRLMRKRIIAAAASVAVVLTAGWGVWRVTHAALSPMPSVVQSTIVYPDENVKCVWGANDRHTFSELQCYSLQDVAKEADIIVVADVVNVEVYENAVYYSHIAEITVNETLKGELLQGDTVFVRDNDVGEKHTDDGGPMLETGNRVMLFLKEQPDKYSLSGNREYLLACENLGKFFYDRDGRYHSSATYNINFPKQYYLGSLKQLDDYTPKTLEEIKELIE